MTSEISTRPVVRGQPIFLTILEAAQKIEGHEYFTPGPVEPKKQSESSLRYILVGFGDIALGACWHVYLKSRSR